MAHATSVVGDAFDNAQTLWGERLDHVFECIVATQHTSPGATPVAADTRVLVNAIGDQPAAALNVAKTGKATGLLQRLFSVQRSRDTARMPSAFMLCATPKAWGAT